MVHTKLYFSQIVLQICIGTLVPLLLLAIVQVTNLPTIIRKRIYVISGCLVQVAVFSMRWNVVIGGQLFSKSFLGYTTYKMALVTKEGLLMAIFLTLLPLAILWVLLKLLPPWPDKELAYIEAAAAPTT
jgi:predicted membrane protein